MYINEDKNVLNIILRGKPGGTRHSVHVSSITIEIVQTNICNLSNELHFLYSIS